MTTSTLPAGARMLLAQTARAALLPLRLLLLAPALIAAAVLLASRGNARPTRPSVAPAALQLVGAADRSSPDLSVVVPFYNPGDALRPTVARLLTCLGEAGVSAEVIAVSDGSTDGSERTLDGLGGRLRVLVQPVNRGKGAALRRGFAEARGTYVGFVDADGDIDPRHLVDYLALASSDGHDLVYASKRHPRSGSASSPVRKAVSWGYIAVVGALFALGVQDTQTGCKIIRREVLAPLLPLLHEDGFALDLELFVVARAHGVRRMAPAPVELRERLSGSTVTARSVVRTLLDTLTVLGRLHLTSAYRGGVHPVAAPALAAPTPAAVRALPTLSDLKAA